MPRAGYFELLDIVCRKGASLFPASERVGEAGKVIGIDFSANMIAETHKALTKKGVQIFR
ncbi:methyltransferase domain-containing protein [Acetivibrio cellulolyticus]|uniref:methyltransferase domain-containing protein n=1 Tax=Acetivibrio cellulolyticus TaxID=35830 RepID=UPI000E3CC9D6